MATRKTMSVVPGSADTEQDEPVDDLPEFAIDRVLAAVGEAVPGKKQTSIKLYREVQVDHRAPHHVQQQQVKNAGKMEWLRDYSPEELDGRDLELVRSQFGAGKYEFRVYGYRDGSPYYGVIAKPEVLIGTLPGGYEAPPQQSAAALAPAPQNDLAAAFAMLAEGQQKLLEAVTHRPDPMASMKEMLQLQILMREATGLNAPAHPKSSITELIEAMREVRSASELFGGEPPKSETDKLIELAQPLIGMAAQAMQQRQPQQLPAVPQVTMPAAFVQVESTPVVQTENAPKEVDSQQISESEMIAKVQRDLAHLITLADSKKLSSVIEGANYVYEELPDEFMEVLENEMWWTALSGFEPKVVAHEKWFSLVRERVLKMLKDDEDADPQAPTQSATEPK